MTAQDVVLRARDLSVCLAGPGRRDAVLDGVELELRRSQILGVVGESGSGKSTLCRAIARLLPAELRVTSGSIELRGVDLLRLRPVDVHRLRQGGLAMIFQNSFAALDPVMRVGDQIVEAVRARSRLGPRQALDRSVELLSRMGLVDAGARLRDYPHQFSGGQRQRIVIAIALASDPAVLLADEPTSSLDVTTQASILHLLKEISSERGTGIIFVSHNYAVVSQLCSSILVLYAGRAMERGPTGMLLRASRHPYSAALIASLPSVDRRMERLPSIPGTPPSAAEPPPGCPFHPRCAHAEPGRCDVAAVALEEIGDGHATACIRAREIWPVAGSPPLRGLVFHLGTTP